MYRERCKVLENKKGAPGHYILRLDSAKISKNARPGQFVQILCANTTEPLLPRPFSFLSASKRDFSVLYQVVGQGTKILSQTSKGDLLWILGPLGNGFDQGWGMGDGGRKKICLLVGGGVGIPPLYYLAQQLIKKIKRENIHVFLGAREKSILLCEKDFKKLGVLLHLATDDGSRGYRGFVTTILDDFLSSSLIPHPSSHIYACGPTLMLKAVSLISQKYNVPCEVSVEVPMACGFGACLGCAIRVRSPESGVRSSKSQRNDSAASPNSQLLAPNYRFAIACCEGPVFQAQEIIWDP